MSAALKLCPSQASHAPSPPRPCGPRAPAAAMPATGSRGLLVAVYRPSGGLDPEPGKLTSEAHYITVTTIRETGPGWHTDQYPVPDEWQDTAPAPQAPEAVLVLVRQPGTATAAWIEPPAAPAGRWARGDCYAGTDDYRWPPVTGAELIPVHDIDRPRTGPHPA
jgi:hypothetical protein